MADEELIITTEEEPQEPEETPAEVPEEKEEEPKEDPLETLKAENEKTRKALEDAQKEINRLGYKLRKPEEKKETKEETPTFSKGQLLQLWNEHKDDPAILMQIVEEMQKTAGKGIEEAAEKKIDITNKRTEMDKFLSTAFPDVIKEDTGEHRAVQGAVDFLHLEGHPFARFLAVGAMQLQRLPKIIEDIKEQTRKELLGKTAEEKRKEGIKNASPTPGGKTEKPKAATLTPSQMESAKRLGFDKDPKKLARYAEMVGAKGGTYATA